MSPHQDYSSSSAKIITPCDTQQSSPAAVPATSNLTPATSADIYILGKEIESVRKELHDIKLILVKINTKINFLTGDSSAIY